MGQEESRLIDDDAPTRSLAGGRNLEALAQYIKDGRAKKVVVMTGAGISTSAGIPDFRSPDTGLYANLSRLNLPHAEAVFDISYFRQTPEPFYTLAQELYPGRYRPTITHSFIRLLQDKGMLLKLFTQNIDCLEREAGVSDGKIIEAHGSFARQSCIECKASYPDDLMKQCIEDKRVPHCLQHSCEGLVKPEIVFFGEQLPAAFFENRTLPAQADLCIVLGTSLSVQPFASLPFMVTEGVPRVLINKDIVGDLGSQSDDVLLLGDCDDGVRRLAAAVGWLDELESLWAQTAPKTGHDISRDAKPTSNGTEPKSAEEEVDLLTTRIEESLRTTDSHSDFVNGHIERSSKPASHFDSIPPTNSETKSTSTPPPRETHSPVSPTKADMMSKVAQALGGGDEEAEYIARYVNAKTGKTNVRVPTPETASGSANAPADVPDAVTKAELRRQSGGEELGHVFPFASKKAAL